MPAWATAGLAGAAVGVGVDVGQWLPTATAVGARAAQRNPPIPDVPRSLGRRGRRTRPARRQREARLQGAAASASGPSQRSA